MFEISSAFFSRSLEIIVKFLSPYAALFCELKEMQAEQKKQRKRKRLLDARTEKSRKIIIAFLISF
jgi:hypothetical protein